MRGAAPVVFMCALGMGACGDSPERGPEEPPPPPSQIILLYDRSSSIQDHELQHYRQLTNELMGNLRHGDRVVAMELLQLSLAEAPRRWAQEVPRPEAAGRTPARDSVTLVRFATDVRDYLRSFTDVAQREEIMGTDLLSTLQDVGDELRGYPDHHTTLVIFSDMLQATQDINMEGLFRMPDPDWVRRAQAEGRLPDLSGVCVLISGARVDTPGAQRVKAFWMEYFTTTGAALLDRNYAYRPPRLVPDTCPGA